MKMHLLRPFCRLLALLLALLLLLSFLGSCNLQTDGQEESSATSNQEEEAAPLDPDRPLPTLAEKYVTDSPEEGDLVLVGEGVEPAQILLPADCPEKVRQASLDLQNHIHLMTGVTLPILSETEADPEKNAIHLGETAAFLALGIDFEVYPNGERIIVRREGNNLFLCGNDSGSFGGTQYAVTRFLEEAGCGWYASNSLFWEIPSLATLAVKEVSLDAKPRFTTRHLGSVNSAVAARWGLGGQNSVIGHGMSWLAHYNTYYDEHPEWYALVDGSRDPSRFHWWQFCYTNKELAAFVARKIISAFDANPYLTNYSVAANDGWDEYWCECENCVAAGNDADELLILANNVAEIVCQKYPDKQISILAYHSTYLPPLNTKAHPNAEVMFTLETSPFADLSQGELIHDGLHGLTKNVYTQSWKDSCNQYIEETGLQHKAIWGWYCIGTGRGEWGRAPWVQGNVISRNLALFEEMGVEEVFYDCSGELDDLRWPLFYPLAACMWDDKGDAESVIYDACIKLYGAAADEMFLYYRHLADAAQEGFQYFGITWLPPYLIDIYSGRTRIVEAIENVKAKMDLLSEEERARVENQLHYWDFAAFALE